MREMAQAEARGGWLTSAIESRQALSDINPNAVKKSFYSQIFCMSCQEGDDCSFGSKGLSFMASIHVMVQPERWKRNHIHSSATCSINHCWQ